MCSLFYLSSILVIFAVAAHSQILTDPGTKTYRRFGSGRVSLLSKPGGQGGFWKSEYRAGIWHHVVDYVSSLGDTIGLRVGQELILIKHSRNSEGIPCVGSSPAAVLQEFKSVKENQEFIIVVREGNNFKSLTVVITKLKPKPGFAGRPISQVTIVLFSKAFTSFPQKTETVFIQPFTQPWLYMKNTRGRIEFAALQQNQPEWKFQKMTFLNFTALQHGQLEVHAVFKVYDQSLFLHNDQKRASLRYEAITSGGAPINLFNGNTFTQHFQDPHADLSSYEMDSHRGTYMAFDAANKRLIFVTGNNLQAKFFTKPS